jgi:integrase
MVMLSSSTINRHVQFLQRVFTHAQEGLNEPVKNIKWRAFIAIEPETDIYPLTEDEERWVVENIDPSVRPVFLFSMVSGVRLKNAVYLRWDMIDWAKGEIKFRAKSRRPGGKIYIIPITEPITLVLKGQEGNDPEFVFTFEAKRNDRHGHRQGRRYPLTKHVVRHYWEQLGLGKRWHDVRHTFGTRLYGISKDIHLVQRAMNHSNVATTMKYVHTNREDVREAMEKLPFRKEPSPFRKVNDPSANEHNQDKFGQHTNVVILQRKQSGAVERTRTSTPRGASTSS